MPTIDAVGRERDRVVVGVPGLVVVGQVEVVVEVLVPGPNLPVERELLSVSSAPAPGDERPGQVAAGENRQQNLLHSQPPSM